MTINLPELLLGPINNCEELLYLQSLILAALKDGRIEMVKDGRCSIFTMRCRINGTRSSDLHTIIRFIYMYI